MLLTYTEFFNRMNYEVRQQVETGDLTVSDEFRLFPEEEGKNILNDVMVELMTLNKSKFQKRISHVFQTDATRFVLPSNYRELAAFRSGDERQWRQADDATNLDATIYVTDEDTMINTDGWSQGDVLEMVVIRYPDKIVADADYIDKAFRDHDKLLLLSCKEYAFGSVGKDMMPTDLKKLMELRNVWMNDVKKIKSRSFLTYKGADFGRRRHPTGRIYR